MFTVVGLTDNQVSTGGDPVIYITLRDSQELQFELAPPAARRVLARGARPGSTDTVNAIIARVSPNAAPERVASAARQWKHLAAMTQAEQETILTRSGVEAAMSSAKATPLVELHDISKHFGEGETRVDALRGVTMEVYPGQVVGLLGPSGSGKTTLLNVIACILEPSDGRMRLETEPEQASIRIG